MKTKIFAFLAMSVVWSSPVAGKQAYSEAQIRQAFQIGYASGWNECKSEACGKSSSSGNEMIARKAAEAAGVFINPDLLGGSGKGHQLPPDLLKLLGSNSSVSIPDNWFVVPSELGMAVMGTTSGNTFKPFVMDGANGLQMLPESEIPKWASDPKLLGNIMGSKQITDGITLLPIAPKQ